MISLDELKHSIEDDTLTIDLLVFVCKDKQTWLADQYINWICDQNGYKHNLIDSLTEVNKNSAVALIGDFKKDLNIIRTDVFKENYDFDLVENTIIVCEKIDKKLSTKLEQYIVEVPKLTDWQVKDYIKQVQCPTLSPEATDWLYTVTNGNVYAIDNELDKVNLFDPKLANEVLLKLKNDKNSHLYGLNTFKFVDALINNDRLILTDMMAHRTLWDSDPIFILTLMVNKLKQLILIKGNSGVLPTDLKLTSKQIWALKNFYRNVDLERMEKQLKFLSSINLRLNLGQLDYGNSKILLDYIVCNLISN